MSDSQQKPTNLAKDTRTPCKFGAECYQKNPFHLNKYKHPWRKKDESGAQRPSKRRKIETVKKEEKFTNNVSESDDDDDDVNEDTRIHNAEKTQPENVQMNEALNIPGTSDNSVRENNTGAHNTKKTESEDDDASGISKNGSGETIIKAKDIAEIKRKIRNDVSDSEDEADLREKECRRNGEKLKLEGDENKSSNGNTDTAKEINRPPKANFDKKEFIKSKFLVDMPSDFYTFWEFCKNIQRANPLFAVKDVGLTLVGPYDVLAGKFDGAPESDVKEYLVHWRYYFDVPEFQTVLKGDDANGYHIGYFRDSPDELPVFLASNRARSDGVFSEMGENIFAAVGLYLEDLKKTCDPFKKMQVSKIASLIKAEAEKLDLPLSLKTQAMRKRNGKTVAKTFNKIGLVVPYNRKTQVGYRELALPNAELKKLLEKLAGATPEERSSLLVKLQPVLTYASIAADECDFGTSVELGWDILYCGAECLNTTVANFLATAYRLLNREAFALIIEAHMKKRRKGSDLSIL